MIRNRSKFGENRTGEKQNDRLVRSEKNIGSIHHRTGWEEGFDLQSAVDIGAFRNDRAMGINQ
jgi:hypothetical protein